MTIADREAPDGSLLAVAQPLLYLIWLPVALGAMALFVYVVSARVGYPYPLEWLEPDTPDIVGRILHGQSIYTAPSYEFVSSMKTPLYYYVVALVSPIFGDGLLPGRLVSILSTAGTCALLWRFVRREGGSRLWALFGIALFLASYGISRQWYDIARIDALFLFILLAAIYALRFWRGTVGAVGAGLLFTAAFFAKQTTLLVAIPVLSGLALSAPRRAVIGATAVALPVLLGLAILHLVTDGWSTYFLVEVPRYGGYDGNAVVSFWTQELLPPLAPALAAAVAWIIAQWRTDRAGALFHGGLLLGALLCGWLGWIHLGGTSNVLMPIFAALALMMPLGLQRLLQWNTERQPLACAFAVGLHMLALVQLALLAYDPSRVIPDANDRAAAAQLLAFLDTIDGNVLVMDDRYFAKLAGKTSLDFSVVDLLRVTQGDVPDDFKRSVIDALQARKFVGIVDPPDFVGASVRLGPPIVIPMSAAAGHVQFRPRPEMFYPVE